uniref:Uncharacterized protein n=1 Tax=Panagrolaimus davidi TaxID=227884 RepID=A0A914PBK4_9BILA
MDTVMDMTHISHMDRRQVKKVTDLILLHHPHLKRVGCTTCKLSQISLTTDPESGIAPTTTYPNDEISGCTDTTVTCNFGNGATGSMKVV